MGFTQEIRYTQETDVALAEMQDDGGLDGHFSDVDGEKRCSAGKISKI